MKKRVIYIPSHCVKSVQIRSYFWSIFSCIQFGHFSRSVWFIWRKLNTQINCNSNKCNLYFPVFGLNTGRYGPEITPYFDTFHAVSVIRQKKNLKLVVKRTQSRSKFQENKLLKYFVKYYVLNLTLFPATFSQY